MLLILFLCSWQLQVQEEFSKANAYNTVMSELLEQTEKLKQKLLLSLIY